MSSRWTWLLVGVFLVLAGCSGKKRNFAETSPLQPGAGGSGADAAANPGSGDSPIGSARSSAEDGECGPEGCLVALGGSCATSAECSIGSCEASTAGASVCCAEACSAQGQTCTADGAGCAQCNGTGSQCDGATLRTCTNGALAVQECGNGCSAAAGACNDLRTTGTGCERPAQCASSVCAVDATGTSRCCATDCAAAGRVCGTDGSCVCPNGGVEVAGSCQLPNGSACQAGADCVSGSCVATVAGPNVCCASACAGAFCSVDGSACVECEGAASTCAGGTSQRCENGALIDAVCGNGCDPATGVCTGLLANGQACAADAQCATSTCDPDVSGVLRCCTPNCGATGRVCGIDGSCVCPDPTDTFIRGACRGPVGQTCAADGDCQTDACESTQSSGQVCCTGACNGQICRANGQGCVQCDGGGPTCQGASSRACVNNTFVSTACANGCNAGTGLCNNLIPVGSTGCTQSNQCASNGSCQGGRCCEFDCAAAGRTCDATGICQCPGGTTPVGGACLLGLGADCSANGQCASGSCQRWFPDADGDLHGSSDPSTSIQVCTQAGQAPRVGFVLSSDDCCDTDPNANPAQTERFDTLNACGDFDYDCDDRITNTGQENIGVTDCDQIPFSECSSGGPSDILWKPNGAPPPCGMAGTFEACGTIVMGRPVTVCAGQAGGSLVNTCR